MTGARPIPPHRHHVEQNPKGRRLAALTLLALGVVYGDLGTSPMYAFRETFKTEFGLSAAPVTVYGLLSLIVWSLILIVSIKYLLFIMRADNRGEGGILSLLALLLQRQHRTEDWKIRGAVIALGLIGAALLYGDGIITPAISVLSATEGLGVIAPRFKPFIIPTTMAILVGIFAFQKHGTARVGSAFGPITFVWFITIATLGAMEVFQTPEILKAVWPGYAVDFFIENRSRGFFALGAVVLCVTGTEALYADMGHFGKKPIRMAWMLVFPSLLLNYFGQGALVLRNPAAAENPFFLLAPNFFLIPLVVIATLAAIVASQALISGAFSITQQCVQLGYSPRVTIIHTSKSQAGQIYIPEVNKALAIGCLTLVFFFKSSTALGAAYGIATVGTMAVTSIFFGILARIRWNWPLRQAIALGALFLMIDFAFFSANANKIAHGGWVPIALAMMIFTLMTTWKKGREVLGTIMRQGTLPLGMFLEDVERRKPVRVSGTAVFLTSDPEGAPVVLLHHVKHNKVLHQQVVLLSIQSAEVPETSDEERIHVEALTQGFFRVRAVYGFMETPDVKEVLAQCEEFGLHTRPQETSYYLGRERLIPTGRSRMMRWRKKLFVIMSRNARSATEFFGIPPNRVVELGTQIEF